MILLAESGSTKCNWLLAQSDHTEILRFNTLGMNPYFYSSEEITREFLKSKDIQDCAADVKEVYFYGAGCSSAYYKGIMADGLQSVFPHARIEVDHDLTACAFACYRGTPVICCILGTGCNSCFFDGDRLTKGQPSLGYVMGDEGSGNYFGKWLLRQYYYGGLPSHLSRELESFRDMDLVNVSRNIYEKDRPNAYLAGFMPFLSRHMDDPFVKPALEEGFREFLSVHVKCFSEYKNHPVHFVGSVAFHLWPVLESVLKEEGMRAGEAIEKPLDRLLEYHRTYGYRHVER